MRSSDLTSSENQHESATRVIGWGTRTFTDATGLLIELARAHRGFVYYKETSPQRDPLCDRAFRALSSEIQRAGPVEILLEDEGLRLHECDQQIQTHGVQREFEDALRRHGLFRIRFSSPLTLTALHGLLDQLVHQADRFGDASDFARNLSARDARGIALNEGTDETTKQPIRNLDETPLRAAATAGSPIAEGLPGAEGIDADPLAMPSSLDRGERLRARLIELDMTHDDEAYRERASEIVAWAEELSNDGHLDDCYRAEVVLADHAIGSGGRGEVQARIAATSLTDLATGIRLEDLVERAVSSESHPVRPSQMLLQLGEHAAPVIFERLCDADNAEAGVETEGLESLLMTLGETALPPIFAAIRGQDDRRAQVAIRLMGQIQSPAAYPVLIDALKSQALGRRVDAIRALSFLPGDAPKEAIEEALKSDLEEVAIAATQAFAANDGGDAVPRLLDALDVSLHSHRTQLSQSLIEVLGRLGDERAVPRLSAALERKPLIRRAHWHAAQLAAVDALAILPTKEARRSIERAAMYGAPPIQDRARARLSSID